MSASCTRPPSAFVYPIDNIRLGEFDLGGVLYHANYFHIFEAGREALLHSGDYPYSELVSNNAHLAIVESHNSFHAPVRYGEAVKLYLWVSDLRQRSMVFNYEIESQAIEPHVIHAAWTKMVYVELKEKSFRVVSMPERLREIFRRFS